MAKLRVTWAETTTMTAVIEIDTETIGADWQDHEDEIESALVDYDTSEAEEFGMTREIDEVIELEKTTVPADIKAPTHEPEF